jgi:muramoyltetrapeptide carboxypeptidase
MAGVSFLQANGFSVVLGDSVFRREGYRSGGSETRASALHAMFESDSVNLILNTTGGFNSNELLDFLDYDLIRAKPKFFVGYSDITAVNVALYAIAGIPAVSGCMLGDFVDHPACFLELFKVLSGEELEYRNPKLFWEDAAQQSFPAGAIRRLEGKKRAAVGDIICGNLSTFNLLLGTRYFPKLDKSILFLEYDKEEKHALPSLQRYLWQLRQAGGFDALSALVFGSLQPAVRAEEDVEWGCAEILREVTDGHRFPVLFNAGFGHLYPSWNLPFGRKCEIDGTTIKLSR